MNYYNEIDPVAAEFIAASMESGNIGMFAAAPGAEKVEQLTVDRKAKHDVGGITLLARS